MSSDAESMTTAPAVPLTLPTQVPLPHLAKRNEDTSFFASINGEKEDQDRNALKYVPSRQKDRELEKSVRRDSMTATRVPDRHSSTWQPPSTWQSTSHDEDDYYIRREEGKSPELEEDEEVRRQHTKRPSRPQLGRRRTTS